MTENRKLTSHIVNPCNDQILIEVLDGPGPGGANHVYSITTPPPKGTEDHSTATETRIAFQNGAIAEVGTNGVTHEALLAILIDRMQGFQKGLYACRENAIVLTHLEEAQMWLQKRTRDRMARGVEGTMKV